MSDLQKITELLRAARGEIATTIYGQSDVIEQALTTILCGGHMLLIGLPGLAKTRLVRALSRTLGLESKRVQCTPDLMPSDIIGTEILEEVDYGRRNFRFIQGPVFCQLLMVDEINRASPRTQSALLQAMEEKTVTITGREHALPAPFHVLATQNPLEQEGTYNLPEAQLDRFMMRIEIGYPDEEAEMRIIDNASDEKEQTLRAVINTHDLMDIQKQIREMSISKEAMASVLDVVRRARPETTDMEDIKKYIAWGPSPRASKALVLGMRAHALIKGRTEVRTEDLGALLKPVLAHRIALTFEAQADGVSKEALIKNLATRLKPF